MYVSSSRSFRKGVLENPAEVAWATKGSNCHGAITASEGAIAVIHFWPCSQAAQAALCRVSSGHNLPSLLGHMNLKINKQKLEGKKKKKRNENPRFSKGSLQ